MVERTRIALCVVLLTACGGNPKAMPSAPTAPPVMPAKAAPSPPPKPTIVGVALTVSPLSAQVFIDDKLVGEASTLDPVIALEPGLHQLVVRHDGYKPYRVELTVSDKSESVTVRLERDR